jgi:hypothetical protein
MSRLARLNIVIDTVDARRRLDELGSAGRRSAQVIARAFQQMSGRIGGILRQLTGLKAAFAALGAGLIARDFIKVANTLEQVEFQLNAVTKSQKLTEQILGNTRKFATEVSFSFEDLAESAKLLTPQLKNNVQDVDFFLRAAADVSAVTGLAVTDSASQIARMFNSGAASADLFRERGVLAMMKFEAGASYSVEETRKKMIAAFEEGGSVLAGVAPMMATTLNGVLSMIGDKVFELKASLMDAGVFDFIKAGATVINENLNLAIEDLKKDGTAAGQAITKFMFGAMLSAAGVLDGVVAVKDAVSNFFNSATKFFNSFNGVTGGALAGMGFIGFVLFGAKGALLGVMVGLLAGLADDLLSWMSSLVKRMLQKIRDAVEVTGTILPATQAQGKLTFGNEDLAGMQGVVGEGGNIRAKMRAAGFQSYDKNGKLSTANPHTFTRGPVAGSAGGFSSPIFGMEDAYSTLTRGIDGAGNYQSQFANRDSGFTKMFNEGFGKIANMGEGGGELPAMDTGYASYGGNVTFTNIAEKSISRMQELMRSFGGAGSGDLGGNPDTKKTQTDAATAKAALTLELTQQYGQKLKELEQQLLSNTITQDQFNFSNDLYKDLIAAGIPLTGQLTAAQEAQKMGILQLNAAQENHRQVMEDLKTTYIDYTNRFSEGWLETVNTAANVAERTKEIGASMYSSLEQGLTTFIKTGRLNFKDFLREMITDYLAAQARMAMAGLFKSVAGMFGGGLGSIAGSFAYGGQSAGGGAVLAGRAYTVGERGRETFVPNTGGRIVPNGEGGGNVSVVQNFDFSNADEAVLARLQGASQEIQNQTFSSVFEAIGQGGTYAKASGRR